MNREQVIKTFNIKFYGTGKQEMLFVHGFGCDQHMWRFITGAFLNDYKLILVDLMGCGNSDLAYYNYEKYDSLNGHTEDIISICDALQLKNIIYVGHSVSCMIGALASIKRPELFEQIVMVCPSPRYINDEGYNGGFTKEDIEGLIEQMEYNYLGWAEFLPAMIVNDPMRTDISNELREAFCRNNPEIALQFARTTFYSDNRNDIEKIKVRSLIIQCHDDIVAPMEVGYYMNKRIADSELAVVKAIGHCPHMSAPEETITVMRSFLYN